MRFKDAITTKISLITLTALLVLSGYFIISSYVLQLDNKTTGHLGRLDAIAINTASQINGDAYQQLTQKFTDKDQISSNQENAAYFQIHNILSKAKSVNNLNSPIYTLSLDSDKKEFFFGVNSEVTPYFRHSYASYPADLLNKYTTGGQLKPYEDEHGEWLSSFAPIKNKKGETVGIVQVDEKLSNFNAFAKKSLYKNVLFSTLIVLILAFFLRRYLNYVIQLMKDKEIAEEKAEIKAKFLSTMSHEIRTPMNAVIGLTNILMQENPRADQSENLETLKFSADMLLALINDVLDYSKIEAGKISFENIQFDLHQLINNIGNSMRVHAKRKQLPLVIDVAPTVSQQVIGDPVRLSQIITNLCGNAIKFTEKGEVRIQLKSIKKDLIRFSIIDTGIGISQDKFEEIFKSFSQADSATTRKFGGTGLGLSITKRLLELQDSSIQLSSQTGKGSTFYFDLNLKTGTNPVSNKGNKPEFIEKFDGIKILLVEDNKINVVVANKFLTKWGLEVDVAENGKIALDMIQQNQYELVLMDLDMPVMDGYESTLAIRNLADPKYHQIPIIALSASAVSDFRERAIEVGMNEYVTKPFKPHELNNVLSKFIGVTA